MAILLIYLYLNRNPHPYFHRLDNMAVQRFRDPDMTYGLSMKEIEEPFTNRNKVIITPSDAIYRSLTITYERPCHYSSLLSRVLPRIYPFETISIRPDVQSVVNYIEKTSNTIGIVSDEGFQLYLSISHSPPKTISKVRHITSLGVETPTLILPPSFQIPGTSTQKAASKQYATYRTDWYDLKLPDRPFRIGTTVAFTTSHLILRKIIDGLINYDATSGRKYLPRKPEIVFVKNTIEDIKDAFSAERIDAFFIVSTHPNPVIQQLVVQDSYQLLGLDGIDPKTYRMLFPNAEETILDTSYYGMYASRGFKSMQHPIHVIANAELSKQTVHSFLESIFRNFTAIKTGIGLVDTEDKEPLLKIEVPPNAVLSMRQVEFKAQTASFSPEYLYPRYQNFPIHPGAESYFREIGVITNNDSPECAYTIGISNCDKVPYINPYRLML